MGGMGTEELIKNRDFWAIKILTNCSWHILKGRKDAKLIARHATLWEMERERECG